MLFTNIYKSDIVSLVLTTTSFEGIDMLLPYWFKFIKAYMEDCGSMHIGRLILQTHSLDEAEEKMYQAASDWNDGRYLALNGPFGPYQKEDEAQNLNPYNGQEFSEVFRIDPGILAHENGRIVTVAQTIYEDESFPTDVAVLADLLEEGGCVDNLILSHCRESHEGAQGCWVIDLIRHLSREVVRCWLVRKVIKKEAADQQNVVGVVAAYGDIIETRNIFAEKEAELLEKGFYLEAKIQQCKRKKAIVALGFPLM